jgi:hypothetical protein
VFPGGSLPGKDLIGIVRPFSLILGGFSQPIVLLGAWHDFS